MTSGGISKRTFCVWATVAFFIVAILLAIASNVAFALGALAFGLVSLAGVWTNGLTKSPDPSDEEWHAIR